MIPVTPIAGRTVLLNANLIEAIEETPDTVITLAGGRRMVVVDVPAHAGVPGAHSGRQRRHGRNPASLAAAAVR